MCMCVCTRMHAMKKADLLSQLLFYHCGKIHDQENIQRSYLRPMVSDVFLKHPASISWQSRSRTMGVRSLCSSFLFI